MADDTDDGLDPTQDPIGRNLFVLGALSGAQKPRHTRPKNPTAIEADKPKIGDGNNEDAPDTPGQYSGL